MNMYSVLKQFSSIKSYCNYCYYRCALCHCTELY